MEISTKPINIFIAKKIISPHFLFIAISFKMWAGCILSVFFKKQTKNQIKVIPQLLINLFLLYFQIDYLGSYLISATHRTFPVPQNVPAKVPLFLVSSVFPYSKGEQGRYGEPFYPS